MTNTANTQNKLITDFEEAKDILVGALLDLQSKIDTNVLHAADILFAVAAGIGVDLLEEQAGGADIEDGAAIVSPFSLEDSDVIVIVKRVKDADAFLEKAGFEMNTEQDGVFEDQEPKVLLQ